MFALALAAARPPAPAQDWPQWGGNDPGRNMYSPAKGLPLRFEPGKSKAGSEEIDPATTRNVRWVAKLGSQSYGNPVVARGRVLIGTNNESPRDPRHRGDRSILLCLDEKNGDLQWQLVIPKHPAGKAIDWENLGLLCSPTVEGNRVYLTSTRCEILCLDLEGQANGNDGPFKEEADYQVLDTGQPPVPLGPKDADIIWRYNLLDELGVFPHNAANCAPLVVDNLVYVGTANGHDWTHANVPFPFAPSLVALDKQTGQFQAADDCGIGSRMFHGQWSSPSAGTVAGRALVFLSGADGVCYALQAQPRNRGGDGVLPKVWWADCNPPEYKVKEGQPIKYPDAEGPSELNATPVFYRNRVYVATGQDPEYGEGVGRLVCLDATRSGDLGQAGVRWDYRGLKRSLSTVSIDPATGLLFVADFSGFLHCLDAETGEVFWIYDLKAHVWGSTLVADGKVYVGDEDGDFVVLPARKEFDPKRDKPLFETNLGAPIYATPMVANGTLYVASQSHLYAVAGTAPRLGGKE